MTDDLLDGYVQGMIARKTLANFDNDKKQPLLVETVKRRPSVIILDSGGLLLTELNIPLRVAENVCISATLGETLKSMLEERLLSGKGSLSVLDCHRDVSFEAFSHA